MGPLFPYSPPPTGSSTWVLPWILVDPHKEQWGMEDKSRVAGSPAGCQQQTLETENSQSSSLEKKQGCAAT